jgi:heptosyltransferase I
LQLQRTELSVHRILLVKLSSLGDVIHAMPVVYDVHQALSKHVKKVQIDWVVEPGFSSLVRRVQGVNAVIECPQRRWRKTWWRASVRQEFRAFRHQLASQPYDAIIDLQGLLKSAWVARLAQGPRFGLANRTEGSGFETLSRCLMDQCIRVPTRIHAVDRARVLVGAALNYVVQGAPVYGLRSLPGEQRSSAQRPHQRPPSASPTVVFVHGTSRADKLWPQAHWIALGQCCIAAGWSVALPQASAHELHRAQHIAQALGTKAQVWPAMALADLLDHMALTQGVIGVDSGLSHLAVALNLPHVQLYNFPTAWRTGPQAVQGQLHQCAVQAEPGKVPDVKLVLQAWQRVSCRAI